MIPASCSLFIISISCAEQSSTLTQQCYNKPESNLVWELVWLCWLVACLLACNVLMHVRDARFPAAAAEDCVICFATFSDPSHPLSIILVFPVSLLPCLGPDGCCSPPSTAPWHPRILTPSSVTPCPLYPLCVGRQDLNHQADLPV